MHVAMDVEYRFVVLQWGSRSETPDYELEYVRGNSIEFSNILRKREKSGAEIIYQGSLKSYKHAGKINTAFEEANAKGSFDRLLFMHSINPYYNPHPENLPNDEEK